MNEKNNLSGLRTKFHTPKDNLSALVEYFLILSQKGKGKNGANRVVMYIAQVSRNLAENDWDMQKLVDKFFNLKGDYIDGWSIDDARQIGENKINLEYLSVPRMTPETEKNIKLNKFLEFHYAYGLHISNSALSDYATYNDSKMIDQAISLLVMNDWNVQKAAILYKTNQREMQDITDIQTIVWREEAQAYVTSTLAWDENCYAPIRD